MKVYIVNTYILCDCNFPLFFSFFFFRPLAVKRRFKDSIVDGDSKLAKKARKLAEAGAAQRNSMMNFVKTGQSTVNRQPTAKALSKSSILLTSSPLVL